MFYERSGTEIIDKHGKKLTLIEKNFRQASSYQLKSFKLYFRKLFPRTFWTFD